MRGSYKRGDPRHQCYTTQYNWQYITLTVADADLAMPDWADAGGVPARPGDAGGVGAPSDLTAGTGARELRCNGAPPDLFHKLQQLMTPDSFLGRTSARNAPYAWHMAHCTSPLTGADGEGPLAHWELPAPRPRGRV